MLFLDNCSAHPSDKDLVSSIGKFYATSLPPNTTCAGDVLTHVLWEISKFSVRIILVIRMFKEPNWILTDTVKLIDSCKQKIKEP